MKLYGLMVIKNEKSRYLKDFLDYHNGVMDKLFILDDQSDDGSFELCQEYDYVVVERRPDDVPTFMEHEGAMRQYSWDRMVENLKPQEGVDWIFCIDADEFAVTYSGDSIKDNISNLKPIVDGGLIHVMEIHGQTTKGHLLQRTDGYWNNSRNVARLMRFSKEGRYVRAKRAQACGFPDYYRTGAPMLDVKILHFGYLRDEDKEAKYRRYTEAHGFGHNPKHIESIPHMTNFNVLNKFNVYDFLS